MNIHSAAIRGSAHSSGHGDAAPVRPEASVSMLVLSKWRLVRLLLACSKQVCELRRNLSAGADTRGRAVIGGFDSRKSGWEVCHGRMSRVLPGGETTTTECLETTAGSRLVRMGRAPLGRRAGVVSSEADASCGSAPAAPVHAGRGSRGGDNPHVVVARCNGDRQRRNRLRRPTPMAQYS